MCASCGGRWGRSGYGCHKEAHDGEDRKLTYDDGMRLWKTRDAYRVQTVLLAVFYFPQLLLVPFIIDALMRGLWEQAGIYGCWRSRASGACGGCCVPGCRGSWAGAGGS